MPICSPADSGPWWKRKLDRLAAKSVTGADLCRCFSATRFISGGNRYMNDKTPLTSLAFSLGHF